MNVDNYELDITDCIQGPTAQQRKFEAKLGVPLHADASTWAQDILPEYDKGTIQGATDEETDTQKKGLKLDVVLIVLDENGTPFTRIWCVFDSGMWAQHLWKAENAQGIEIATRHESRQQK